MVRHEPAEPGHGLVVPAQGELGREPQFEGAEAELGQPFGFRFGQRRRRDVGQRTAVPQAEGLGQQPGRALGIAAGVGPPAVPHQGLEQQRVGVLGGHPQLVAGSAGDEHGMVRVAHQAAQPQHVDADEVAGPGRRVIPPDLADQRVGGNDLPGVDEQGGQHRPPLGSPDRPPVVIDQDLERAEQAEPHHYPGSLASSGREPAVEDLT